MFQTKMMQLALAAAALPASAQTVNVPANLQPPAGHTMYLKARATGTQNYVCLPTAMGGLAWRFQGPQATVFLSYQWLGREIRQQVMTHYLSPNPGEEGMPARATWQSSLDTSAVWAKKIAESSDAAYVAAGAIPWLLLQKTGAQSGPAGGAFLTQTTYLQRINTGGGVAPEGVCTEAGAIQFVPYVADYVFFRASGN
ncbi:MAG: DUF3455 domain-containing protein [Bryobacteraceae bacterium]|nr:DUF3455 domain-containing protein [Bryobacteraceae bacterium]